MKQRAQNPTGCKEENLIKNRERSKTICSLGLIFAFILLGIIIVTTMALAKYVIKDEKDIEVTLRNVRISENEIEIIPSSWTNENVAVSISTKKNGEVYYKINENGEWKKYEKNFEVEENCNIYAKIKYTDGESPETVKEVTNIDKIKPTVEIVNPKDPITPDIQEYTILAGETTTNISKKLIAKDEGGSGLKTLSYAYSQSNTTEPTTYEEFKNEATVTKSATGGNWYIWTKVLDNAGNRAEETKISPAYNVGYQILYDANVGTGAPKEQRKVHGTELKISETIPTRTGYEFQGWATANTATTAELKVGGNYTTDKAVKLYAVWKKYKYLNTTTSKYYMKLSDALNEVKDKETIKAMDYAIETTAPTLAAAKAITFDLNGQTIVMSNVTLTNNGTLTIAGASGTLTGSGADTITNNGTFVKNTATEIASSATADYYVVKNNGTATIGAGKLNGSFRIIRNNGNGILNITGGNFTSKNGIGILNYDNGNLSISGGVIEGKEDTIGSNGSGGNIKISGGSITASEKAGVSICAGTTANITGGNITGRLYGIWSNSNINITIGKNDGNVSIESPKISSNYYGIFMQSGKINFYDGAITGVSGKSIGGTAEKTVEETATNCVVVKTTSGSTETAVLGPSAPVITAKLNNSSGANYTAGTWTNQNVWVQLKSASIGAGIKEYQWYKNGAWTSSEITTASNAGTILFTATRNEAIRFRAIDENDVVSAETVFGVKIDKTGPTISSVTPATTWDYSNDVTVNATDNESISAYAVTTTKTAPTEWIETTSLDLSKVQTKRENGASWARVFYHNNRGGSTLFANETEAKSVDVSYKYSALGTLDNYKDTTGNWEFMLQYPEIKGKYNRWKQTGNPATTTIANGDGSANAPGYSAVHIDWNYDYWGGLTKSTAPETFLNGSVGMGTWFYAIGAYKGWYGGIPGPNDTAVFQGTELWARIDTLTKANKKTLTAKVGNLTTNGTYYVWVKDHLGNVSSKAVTTNKVDTTAPTAPTITNSSGGNWTNQDVKITLSSTDSQSGVLKYQCKYSGTSNRWADAKSTDTWSAARNETIYYRSIDNAGNVSAVSSTAIKIDKTAPAAPTITNSSGGNWTNQSVTTKVTSTDAMSGIAKYQIKYSGTSNAWRDFDNNNSSHTSWAADRNETLYFRAIDNAGNISAESSTLIKIDKTVPTVTINRTSANTFDWKASDTLSGVAGYAVTTSGSTPTSWTTSGTLTGGTKTISAAGTYYVWIKDKAGNVNKATINAYTVTYDYNGTKNYIVPLSNTIKCTGFSGALNTCFNLGTIYKDDLKVGDQLTVSFTASYSGLTGVSGQTASLFGQGSGNVTAWNQSFPVKENNENMKVHWTGTANNVTYTYRTKAFTSADLTNDSWNFMIRTDYYSAGTITISNVKVTRTTRETKTLLHGATLGTLPAPTERGYTLDGWYTAVTGGTKIATTTTATANATYYAHWAQKGYTITLATNGGTYNGATANSIFAATYGNDVNIGYPVKAGYTFNGWKDSTGKIYDRNLLKNAEAPKEFVDGSKSTNALGGWRTASVSGGTRSVVGYQDPPLPGIRKGFRITASGTATSLDVCQDQVPVTVGKYYTISVWAKGSGGLWLQAGNSSYTGKLFSMSNVTSWTKYSWTFKAGTDGSANNNMTNIYFGNHGATGTIDICGMKLEEGTGFKSTLWANTAANTTLTAQWTANNYTIKIDPNGGKFNNSTSVATYTKTFGSTVAATAPTKTGYTFGGWVPVKTEAGATWAEVLYHNNQGGTTLFANETEVKSVNTAQKYSILGQLETFRANTSSQFEFLLKYDEFGTQYNRWKQTSNPTSGTTISGYSAVSNSWTGDSWGGIAKSSSTSYTFLDGSPNADTWWYAIGPYQAYKKGIPGPNDTINMESMSLYVKVNDDLSNITKAVTGVVNSSNNYIVRNDITLKAVWIPNTYTITYDNNFLTNDKYTSSVLINSYHSAGTAPKTTETTDAPSAKYGKTVKFTMNAGTNGGPYYSPPLKLTVGTTYTWSVYVQVSRAMTFETIGSEQGGQLKNVTINATIEKKEWQRLTYTFTAKDTQYYAFTFYNPSGGWKDGDILNIHSLELSQVGGLNTTTATKTYGNTLSSLPTPTRTGYTFNGWYTAPLGGTKIATTTAVPSSNTTYYAHWTVNNYYLDLKGNCDGNDASSINGYGTANVVINGVTDATGVTDYYKQWPYGTQYAINNIKATTGHTYNGVASGSLTGTITGTTSVSLKFTTNKYNLTFQNVYNTFEIKILSSAGALKRTVNISSSSPTISNILYTDIIETSTTGVKQTVSGTAFTEVKCSNVPTRTGYTWNSSVKYTMGAENTKAYRWNGTGWYTDHNGDTQCTAFSRLASTNGYTAKLTIGWTVNNYTVTYNYGTNGGTSATKTTASVAYGSNVDLTPTATKSGWKFVGWSDPDHPSGTTKLTSYKMPAKNVTLYAIYSKTLTGTFKYYNNQTKTVSTTIYNTATKGAITAPAALGTPSGYTFRHWSTATAANAAKTVAASGSITISANTTYYASYQQTVTATFYYHPGTDQYAISQSSTTAPGTKYMGYTGGIVNGSITIPTAVSGSTGIYGTKYAGVSTSTNSLTAASVTTANTKYYAYYDVGVTYYYWNGSKVTASNPSSTRRRALSNGSNYALSATNVPSTTSAYDSASFKNWTYDLNAIYERTPTSTASTTLYAYYQKSVTATFWYYNNGAASKTASGTKSYITNTSSMKTVNGNITVPTEVSANKTLDITYTYNGVSTSSAANATNVTPTTANTTYYANYRYSIKVTFDSNGATSGKSDPKPITGNVYCSYTMSSRTGLSVKMPDNTEEYALVKSGANATYTFSGWNSKNNGTGTAYNVNTSYTFYSSTTVYVRWFRPVYKNTTTNKTYDILNYAMNEAKNGEVIQMQQNSNTEPLEPTVASGKTIYLELNGKTLTTKESIRNNGILYVNHKGSTSGTINYTGTKVAVLSVSSSITSLQMKNATITSNGMGIQTTVNAIILSKVKVTSKKEGIKISAKDNVSTIESCTVNATYSGVQVVDGRAIITSSNITGDYGVFNFDGYIQIENNSIIKGTTYAGIINWSENAGTTHVGTRTATFSTTSEQVTGKTYGVQNTGSKSYMYLDNGRVQGELGATNGALTTTRSGYTIYTTTSGSYKVMYLKAASRTKALSKIATMRLGRNRAISIVKDQSNSVDDKNSKEEDKQSGENQVDNSNQSTDENEHREENAEEDTEKNKEENSSEKITEKGNNIGEYNKEQMDNAKMNAKDVDDYEKEYILLRYEENKYSNNPEELKKKRDTEDIENKTLWIDQTENKLDAIITNANWKDKYLEFNGETTYGTLDKINTKALTIETTISCTKLPEDDDECIIGDAQNNTELLYVTKEGNIKAKLKIGEKEYEATSIQKLEENKVYGITLTYDGKKLVIYINGKEDVRIEIEEGKKFFDNELKLIIGAKSNEKTEIGTDTNEDDNTENDENAISNYFYGNMYTFSIYNEAIDEEKILNNYIYNSKLIKQE